MAHPPLPGSACLMEPFGASESKVRAAKCQKNMVCTRRLELLTSTVSSILLVELLVGGIEQTSRHFAGAGRLGALS